MEEYQFTINFFHSMNPKAKHKKSRLISDFFALSGIVARSSLDIVDSVVAYVSLSAVALSNHGHIEGNSLATHFIGYRSYACKPPLVLTSKWV